VAEWECPNGWRPLDGGLPARGPNEAGEGKYRNLGDPYQPFVRYRPTLQHPPSLIGCDLVRHDMHTSSTDMVKEACGMLTVAVAQPPPTKTPPRKRGS
jgi:hypothetical protein